MNPRTLTAFQSHARDEYPRECCGVIVVVDGKERYVRCRNVSFFAEHFVMDADDYAAAEEAGEIIAICHSHPNLPAIPSQADLAGCEASGVEWHIQALHERAMMELVSFKPSGWQAPLLGVPFVHGVHDCYALVRRYYLQQLRIELPDFPREPDWWLKGMDLLQENFAQAGFVEVDELRPHDGILMQLASPVINHAAVYIGENQIMQHIVNRLSSRDTYGGWYRKITRRIVRHRSLL